MKPPALTDDQIIRMLRTGGAEWNRAWEYMYKNWRTAYSNPVLKRGGLQDEVDEALARIAASFEVRVIAPDKAPVQNLCGYLVRCVLNNWRKWKKGEPAATSDLDESPEPDPEPNAEDYLILQEQNTELDRLLDQIGQPCKQILTLWSENFKMKEIAQLLQLEDEEAARKKKYKCLQKLIDLFGGGSDPGK